LINLVSGKQLQILCFFRQEGGKGIIIRRKKPGPSSEKVGDKINFLVFFFHPQTQE